MTILIRKAKTGEMDILVSNNRAMALETEGKILDLKTAEQGAERVLTDPSTGFYLVIDRGGQILGQCLVTYEWSDWRCGNYWWIQSVYILPAFRRTGLFSQLYRFICNEAEQSKEFVGLRLYVDENNLAAKATYESLGFETSHYRMFETDIKG